MRLTVFIILLSLFCSTAARAQARFSKRELRAAWIATVSNIDWPSKPGLPAAEQQRQFTARLDQLQGLGINTVIVQIRPTADAFYQSDIEPWSRFLTGKAGAPPNPYYDPLAFMIEEAHKRHMDFHAWFNPFRALTDSKKNPNPPGHVTRKHPDWVIHYGGKSYLDPGNPAARDYVLNIISDVVARYDIDAVHIDDYFYPYRIAGQDFGDAASFKKFNNGIPGRDDWRRANVTAFVQQLNTTIKAQKPWMKLGISPFGVWRNQNKDPLGSPTRGGQTSYDDLYADVRLWQEKGWIDYLMPQLYWEHNHKLVGFEILQPWWQSHAYDRHVYYGLGLYRMLPPAKGAWLSVHELLWQIRDIRQLAPGSGYALYSASNLDKITAPVTDSLQATNRYIAIPPAMPWLDSTAPAQPKLSATASSGGTLLRWTVDNPSAEVLRYLVYRFPEGEKADLNRSDRILTLTGDMQYLDNDKKRPARCTYVVSALDRTWNESKGGMLAFPGK